MADKETIIDGIDVNECGYSQTFSGNVKCECEYEAFNGEIETFDECKNCPNCYYKQLKRKEQECEELKIELKKLREWEQANKPTGICETCTAKSVQKADFCRKALNEIEEIAITQILAIIHKAKEK